MTSFPIPSPAITAMRFFEPTLGTLAQGRTPNKPFTNSAHKNEELAASESAAIMTLMPEDRAAFSSGSMRREKRAVAGNSVLAALVVTSLKVVVGGGAFRIGSDRGDGYIFLGARLR